MKYAKQDTYVLEYVEAGNDDAEPIRRQVKAGDPLPPGMEPENESHFEERDSAPPAPAAETVVPPDDDKSKGKGK